MSLSPEVVSLFTTEFTDDPTSRNYSEILGLSTAEEKRTAMIVKIGNGYSVANDPAPSIPTTMYVSSFVAIVGSSVINTIPGVELNLIRIDIESQNRDAVLMWATVGLAKSWFDQTMYDALVALVAATEPDPDWPATKMAPPRMITITNGAMGGITEAELDELVAVLEAL